MTFYGAIYTESLRHWCIENLPTENALTREQAFFGWFWGQSKFFQGSKEGWEMSLQSLDSKGRCCGRKPIEYKRYGGHHFFCSRCDREYDPTTKKQRANWAYDSDGNRIALDIRY